jgi:hypothetical protein
MRGADESFSRVDPYGVNCVDLDDGEPIADSKVKTLTNAQILHFIRTIRLLTLR